MRILIIANACLVAACGAPKLPVGEGAELITIRSNAGYCLGDCTTGELTAASNGKALFVVRHDEEIKTFRPIRMQPWQFNRIRETLSVYRPAG
jgi:hypothetical protein